jgi:hypothetical protein
VAKRKSNRRPAPRPQQASSARRLGAPDQQASQSAGARRRQQAAAKRSSNRVTFVAIGLVLLIVAVFVVIKLTSSTKPPTTASTQSGISSGQHPLAASIKNMVDPVTTISLSVFNSVGVYGQQLPMTVTKGQVELKSGALPQMVYVGGEFCPYCAMSRWAFVAALSRFGTFSGLKVTSSATGDGNIPTFSVLGSTFTSKYLVFTPYEETDRNQAALQTVPNDVLALYLKYDGNGSTLAPAVFNPGTQAGIPFIDIANRAVSSGAPGFLRPVQDALQGGGPASTTVAAAAVIATAMHDPSTPEASALGVKYLIGFANYITAGICFADGGKPSSVCNSAGVQAAMKQFKAAKPIG